MGAWVGMWCDTPTLPTLTLSRRWVGTTEEPQIFWSLSTTWTTTRESNLETMEHDSLVQDVRRDGAGVGSAKARSLSHHDHRRRRRPDDGGAEPYVGVKLSTPGRPKTTIPDRKNVWWTHGPGSREDSQCGGAGTKASRGVASDGVGGCSELWSWAF